MSTSIITPKKWTKKDIKTLCDQIFSVWLTGRPLDTMRHAQWDVHFRSIIGSPRVRKDIVLAGLRAARDTIAERYRKDCECIGNMIARDIYGDKRQEMIDRTTASAREHDADHKILEALVLRVHHEGLPPEVEAFDPTKR